MKPIDVLLIGTTRRSGKSTLARLIQKELALYGIVSGVHPFADEVRTSLGRAFATEDSFRDVDPWTEDNVLKESVVRPLLIAWSAALKAREGEQVFFTRWRDRILAEAHERDRLLSDRPAWILAPDWRFAYELRLLAGDDRFKVRAVIDCKLIDEEGVPARPTNAELEEYPNILEALQEFRQTGGTVVDYHPLLAATPEENFVDTGLRDTLRGVLSLPSK